MKLRILFLAFYATSVLSCSFHNQTVTVKSPDGVFCIKFYQSDKSLPVGYSVRYAGDTIVKRSSLGFLLKGTNVAVGKNAEIQSVRNKEVRGSWKPVYGERNEYPENYNESVIDIRDKNYPELKLQLIFRAYNEGVAFRYEVLNEGQETVISDELTEFSVPAGATAWVSDRAQSEIIKTKVSEIEGVKERPLLLSYSDSLFVAIGEAALVDYARMKFANSGSGVLVSKLEGEVKFNRPFKTPWRYIMAATSPGKILENNYLLLNLNEPNKIEDTSWIKPGKVIREVTLTTRGGKACVDFAVAHGLQYVEFDAGWYGNEYDKNSDATTVTVDPRRSKGPLDLHEIIKYAESKNVGVILYVNRNALEKQLDEVLEKLSSWGVKGVKYGFVNVGSQKWTAWLHEAIRKAAGYKLMVDVHDEYRPTGYSRTYQNFMTQEGIRGDEESPDNRMVLKTLFTRMIAGAGDQTNCYFAPRVDEKMGSHASQLAKSVCIYSPWQFLFWYDRPQGSDAKEKGAGGNKNFISEVPELVFYKRLPTVWDDTEILDGYPGEYAVVARRKGDVWFVGALNGANTRNFKINLGFLDKNKKYKATVFVDDISMNTRTNVRVEEITVTSSETIEKKIEKMNGLAMIINPAE